ncbi:PAS domain-containing sensor histidine kinase [Methanobacterium sp. ACI-7]|uniref:PAS domain-containing sensor histidine kinase n=1 Tax=unclassified Methanobacterium TaxID=2627676 RepID=UPI0039C26682
MLSESENEFKNIINESFNGVFVCDEKGLIINCNSAQEEITGINRFEMIEKSLWNVMFKITPTESQNLKTYNKIKNILQNIFKTGKVPFKNNSYVYDIELDNRTIKTVETRIFPIKTNKGFMSCFITKDITLYEKTKNALQESEAMYKTIFENTGTATIIIEEDTLISLVNSEFEKLSGYSKHEIEGKMNYIEFLANEDDQSRMEKYHSKRETNDKISSKYEFKFLDNDGNIKDTLITVALIPGTKKRLVSLLDITERKIAEEQLKESEFKFKSLAENSPDIIVRYDTDLKITYINRDPSILGLSKGSFKDKITDELMTGKEEDKKWTENLNKALKTGKNQIMEYQLPVSERIRTFQSIITPEYNDKNKIVSLLVISRDITKRKEAEDEIIKSLQEKEILFKEIHHRIKNNMQVISSLLGLQSFYVADQNTRSILKESQERIKSMAIVHEKLYSSEDFTKINFKEYTRDLSLHLFSSFNVIDINFEIEGEDLFLELDYAIPCGLIINELITNSIKYAFPDDEIKGHENNRSLNEHEISVNLNSNENEIIIKISDNGIGISDDKNLETKDTLGFLIVNTLIKQINGKIELINGNGTNFEIKFPYE